MTEEQLLSEEERKELLKEAPGNYTTRLKRWIAKKLEWVEK